MISILDSILPQRETALALGFFDGVHRGHWAVIDAAVNCAAAEGLLPCVFTFTTGSSTPQGKTGYTWLTTRQEKERLLRSRGIELVVAPDFEEIRGLTPQQFVADVLVGQLRARVLSCGEDFHFGKNAAAGAQQLIEICRPLGVRVQVVSAVSDQGVIVSSTVIRRLIAQGDVAQAARLLGRPFGFAQEVVAGKRLGRKLGFPTTNQRLPEGMTLPAPGVYATRTWVEGKALPSVTSIGPQPTVGGQEPLAETYIMGYSGDLYGQEIKVELIERLRPVVRFDTVEQLRQQVMQDAEDAARLLGGQMNK